jgi:endonuclease/exonuclease/phosphatase (EEP) superfamily protein YafD
MQLRAPPRHEMIAARLAFVTGAVCLATLLTYGGRWMWFCDLLVTFRTHFAGLLVLALIAAIAIRRWRIATAAAFAFALNAWPLYGAFVAPESPAVSAPRPLRVVAFNVHISNVDVREIARYLDSLAADVVVLEEFAFSNAEPLSKLLPRLPHRYLAEQDGVWGVAVFSRWPLESPQPVAAPDGRPFAARVDLDLGDRSVRLYGAHLNWPLVPAMAAIRNGQLRTLAGELAQCPQACVAAGDFNVTPWSSHFRDLLTTPGVRDCAAGQGLLYTWAPRLPAVLRIRIDQCLVVGAVEVAGVRVGASVGSDHFATVNDLRIGAPPTHGP